MKLYRFVIFAISFFLFNSCATEDLVNENQISSINVKEAKDFFNANSIELKKNIYYLGNPDWEQGILKKDTLLVPLFTDQPAFVKNLNRDKVPRYLKSYLIITKNKDKLDYKMRVSFYSNRNDLILDRYHLYNMEDILVSDNGKKPEKKQSKSLITSKTTCVHWGYFLTNNETGQDWLVYDWWECDWGADDDEQLPPDGGGGGGGGAPLDDAEVIEDQINDIGLDPCTKDILDQLKNLGGGDIAEMLKRFSPPGSIYNLNMITGPVKDSNVLAQTNSVTGSSTDINLIFNENYIKGKNQSSRPTDLSVATTMAHEIIHAYLISLLEDYKTCGDLEICDFPTIYEAYVQQQIDKDKSKMPSEHHEVIAKKYVAVIAATIQEFHTKKSVPLGFASEIYTDLAWSGLFGTSEFNRLYPNDPSSVCYNDRERIINRFYSEKNAELRGVLTPTGIPCVK